MDLSSPKWTPPKNLTSADIDAVGRVLTTESKPNTWQATTTWATGGFVRTYVANGFFDLLSFSQQLTVTMHEMSHPFLNVGDAHTGFLPDASTAAICGTADPHSIN